MFMIVSPDDCQVYEKKIPSYKKDINYMQELIAYASLDMVETEEIKTNNMYLKQVDKFNDYLINCFVTPGKMRFLLLHDIESRYSDDSIKSFFGEVYEVYVKALLNPFLDKNTKITSSLFENKIINLMKKYL